MFVRVKKNRSGSSSVLVVRKASGRYLVAKNLGVATDEKAIESLRMKGEEWIRLHTDSLPMQFGFDEREEARRVLDNIDFVYHDGARIILNQVYHLIGFDEIKDGILRDLVVARICEPASKRSTLEYLKDYFDEDYTLNKVYYYLDKLGSKQKNTVRRISVEHTRKILGGKIGLMFYDCTSLYFETSNEDKLRAKGFSKDGKTAESQIILGLLVSEDGYPLHYCIHRGDRHEGRTMIPAVNRFMKIFKLDKSDFIIVADAGLMSKDNVKLLKKNGSVDISVRKDRNRQYNNKADPKGNNGYTVGKLYINAASLTKLAQMMYYGGELNGVRILKAETVKLMEADQPGLAESRYGLSTVRLNQFDRGTWYGHQGRYSGLTSNIYYQRETGITMALILDGYDYQLSDNIVMPAVQILTNMEKLETLCLRQQ